MTSIDARLVAAQVAIDRVLGNQELQARLRTYGYSAEQLLQGRALRDQTLELHHQQLASYRVKLAATSALNTARGEANSVYARHVAIVRVALRDDSTVPHALALDVPHKRTRAGWLIQAQHFYANLLADPELMNRLAAYGVWQEQLIGAQDAVKRVEAGLVAQQDTRDAARAATQARDASLAALNRWMRDFLAMARIAMAEQPQLPGLSPT